MENADGISSYYWILIVGTSIMVLLVLAIIVFVIIYQRKVFRQEVAMKELETRKQKELLLATVQSKENERQRIAKDLHDEVGAMLSAIKMSVENIIVKTKNKEALDKAEYTKTIIDDTISNVRRISKDLMPATLNEFGLFAAVKEIYTIMQRSNANVSFALNMQGDDSILTKEQALSLYRVVQELLNNSAKHANAKKINIDLNVETNKTTLLFTDDGRGFDLKQHDTIQVTNKGLGLKNIESRVSIFGGSVIFKSELGRGTQIEAYIIY